MKRVNNNSQSIPCIDGTQAHQWVFQPSNGSRSSRGRCRRCKEKTEQSNSFEESIWSGYSRGRPHKLAPGIEEEIRLRYSTEPLLTYKAIYKEYDVSPKTVHRILHERE